jgi:hypothetical protein
MFYPGISRIDPTKLSSGTGILDANSMAQLGINPYNLPVRPAPAQGGQVSHPDSGNTGSAAPSGGSSSSAPTSSWTPQNQAEYQQATDTAQNALGRLPNQLDIAKANVNDQFSQQYNGLQSGVKDANNQYHTGVTKNQQSHLTDENGINQQASVGLRSLLRILGGMGAGGGSEAKYLAPEAVTQEASAQLGGAGRTYAQNAQDLDTNLNTFMNKEKTQEQQLNDWKTQQLNSAESTSNQSKVNLLNTLAKLAGQRTAAMGGNGVAAEQPYIDQINSLSGEIDNLARFKPTFNGEVPVYTAPSLSSFELPTAPQAQVAGQAAPGGANTPYLDMILGKKKDQTA